MIKLLSKNITSRFIKDHIIKPEEQEVYEYSFQILISEILNYLMIVAIAVATNSLLKSIFFVVTFLAFRLTAGGYHAKTHLKCMLVMLTVFSLFLVITTYMPQATYLYIIFMILAFSCLIFIQFAPVEDENNPLEEEDKRHLRKKTIIYFILFIVAILTIHYINPIFALSMALGMFSVALSILATVLRNNFKLKRGEQIEFNYESGS